MAKRQHGRSGREVRVKGKRIWAFCGALLLIVSGTASTDPATASSRRAAARPDRAVHGPVAAPAEAEAAVRYWTPERMAAATPRDVQVLPGQSDAGPAEVDPRGTIATRVRRPYTNRPDRLVGRLFGRDSQGDFMCSGAVVTARNRSVVWTAGHCVYNDETGEWARQVVFVPAYSSARPNHRPYGTWRSLESWSHTEWVNFGNYEVDVGAVVLRRLNGKRIERRVGAHRIAFNRGVGGMFRPHGYPAQAPFSGVDQWRCTSRVTGRRVVQGFGPPTMRVTCDLTAGSSGGPWLKRINRRGVGTVLSVISYRYSRPTDLYGPYQGRQARVVYREAARTFVP